MTTIGKATPVKGERLVLSQPAALNSLDEVRTMRSDFTRRLTAALKDGLAIGTTPVVLREFFDGRDVLLFAVGADLVIGRIVDSAEVTKARAANARGTRRNVRPDVY